MKHRYLAIILLGITGAITFSSISFASGLAGAISDYLESQEDYVYQEMENNQKYNTDEFSFGYPSGWYAVKNEVDENSYEIICAENEENTKSRATDKEFVSVEFERNAFENDRVWHFYKEVMSEPETDVEKSNFSVVFGGIPFYGCKKSYKVEDQNIYYYIKEIEMVGKAGDDKISITLNYPDKGVTMLSLTSPYRNDAEILAMNVLKDFSLNENAYSETPIFKEFSATTPDGVTYDVMSDMTVIRKDIDEKETSFKLSHNSSCKLQFALAFDIVSCYKDLDIEEDSERIWTGIIYDENENVFDELRWEDDDNYNDAYIPEILEDAWNQYRLENTHD